jgi:hypothetical protein
LRHFTAFAGFVAPQAMHTIFNSLVLAESSFVMKGT